MKPLTKKSLLKCLNSEYAREDFEGPWEVKEYSKTFHIHGNHQFWWGAFRAILQKGDRFDLQVKLSGLGATKVHGSDAKRNIRTDLRDVLMFYFF